MKRIAQFIRKLFSSDKPQLAPHDEADIEALRVDFRERYHNFKLLLSSNNKALEIMAEIEEALQGKRTFGMSFVKAACTSVSVNVFRMVRKIEKLAPGKYAELTERFNFIQQEVDRILREKKTFRERRLVIPLSAIHKDMTDSVGSKMANIGEIRNRLGIRVPPGFAITSTAYQRLIEYNDLQNEIDRAFQATDENDMEELYNLSANLQQMIIRAKIPQDLQDTVMRAYRELEDEAGQHITVALRSSALGEDASGSSFAGQYRSILNVSHDDILTAYKEVAASKYSLQAITYRLNRGFRDEDISMCVGCIAMVDAACGGVMYSRDPVNSENDSIVINSAWGLPKSVVDGSVSCDLIVVSRHLPMKIVHQDIQKKNHKFVCFPEEGVCRMEVTDESGNLPSLTEQQAISLAEIAVKLENHYAAPLDIEWAITPEGTTYILQCRPLQTEKRIANGKEVAVSETEGADTVILKGGITASPGVACGEVYLVRKAVDMLQFPKGGILVAQQSLPRWASLLSRAAGVITEQGSFAGHLANVAREFHVPALFNISGAMETLKPGELITVDASGLAVHRGRIESLLNRVDQQYNLMEGSPVYESLKQAAEHIIPLNLLNPDAPEFKPSNCKTFHDITRFIHEKSVQEMFNFGKEHNFSERSGKQLFYKVPMQWWILNLDDGFKEEVTGKYVHLENIASIPMLALWDGIVAVPWEGPPIDGKGLLSVMVQATSNRSLAAGAKSQYNDRNFFMISKNFCNLSSRLGFHFSTLEALISERQSENYISFQFKGGAADLQRRLQRVQFIGEILEEYDFRVELKEDTLIARVEDFPQDVMIQKMKIMGYLTMHTRQLDMIMSNPASVKYYREKIHREIRSHFIHDNNPPLTDQKSEAVHTD